MREAEFYVNIEFIINNKLKELKEKIIDKTIDEKLYDYIKNELWNTLCEKLNISLDRIKNLISIDVYNKGSDIYVNLNGVKI